MYVQFSESISCCWEQKQICDECLKNGQVSYSPALRACSHCLNNNVQCVNLDILALSSDCETGNRKAMESLEQRQKAGLADHQICVYLPDAVQVGKSCKCCFSNWFCLLDESRSSLAVMHTLREDSNPSIKSQLWKLLAKEDVQNKYSFNGDWANHIDKPRCVRSVFRDQAKSSAYVDSRQIQADC